MKRDFSIMKLTMLLVLAILLVGCQTASRSQNRFALSAEILESGQAIQLSLKLANSKSSDLIISDGVLPWDDDGLVLVLVPAEPAELSLNEPIVIRDPLPTKAITLREHAELRGTIDLTSRFPKLLDSLKSNDVIVFWNYRINSAAKDAGLDRIGGWNIIPKRK